MSEPQSFDLTLCDGTLAVYTGASPGGDPAEPHVFISTDLLSGYDDNCVDLTWAQWLALREEIEGDARAEMRA